MNFTVAVAGKGGVGKSTFAALAVRHLHESTGEVVLAVDADPNANLGYKLGTEPARTVGNLREEMISRGEEPPPGMSKQEYIDYQIRLALKEGSWFDLLTMGRQEGPGCYCYINNMLRTFVDALSDRYRYVDPGHPHLDSESGGCGGKDPSDPGHQPDLLALVHAAATLKHHFVDRDNTLRRMWGR